MVSFDELNSISPDTPELNARIVQYFDFYCEGKFDKCFDCTYPAFFKKYPRKFLLKKMKETLNNDAMIMSNDLATIDFISKVVETESGSYCRIDYTLLIAIQYLEDKHPVDDYEEKKQKSKKKFILPALEAQYGKKNVWFDEITKSYCIHVKNRVIALKDEISPEWTFLTLTDHPVVKEFIPNDVFIVLESQ